MKNLFNKILTTQLRYKNKFLRILAKVKFSMKNKQKYNKTQLIKIANRAIKTC